MEWCPRCKNPHPTCSCPEDLTYKVVEMKPIVYYRAAWYAEVGHSAILTGVIDHPRGLRGDVVHTSRVIAHDKETGRIETLNTEYLFDDR